MEENYSWLNRIVGTRGTFNICKRDPAKRNRRSMPYEGRWTVQATTRAPLERLQKILGGGQITKTNNRAFKKGYAWYYVATGPQVRRLLQLTAIDSQHTRCMKAFQGTFGTLVGTPVGTALSEETLMVRESMYQQMKTLNQKSW